GFVVIRGIIILASSTSDDSARAAIAQTRRRHRVFAVVAATLLRQSPLEIAEDRAILFIWKWSALFDGEENCLSFFSKIRPCDLFSLCSPCSGRQWWRLTKLENQETDQDEPTSLHRR